MKGMTISCIKPNMSVSDAAIAMLVKCELKDEDQNVIDV